MKNPGILFFGCALLGLVGCSGGGDDQPLNMDITKDPGPGMTVDYPMGNHGTRIGDEIDNLHFLYLPNGAADVGKDPTQVSLAEFYAKRKEGAKLLVLSGAARWCVPCNNEADEFTALFQDQDFLSFLDQQGGRQVFQYVQMVLQGSAIGSPSKQGDMEYWASFHKSNYGVGYDPKDSFRPYTDQNAFPRNIYVLLDNMTIVSQTPGAPATLADLKTFLKTCISNITTDNCTLR